MAELIAVLWSAVLIGAAGWWGWWCLFSLRQPKPKPPPRYKPGRDVEAMGERLHQNIMLVLLLTLIGGQRDH